MTNGRPRPETGLWRSSDQKEPGHGGEGVEVEVVSQSPRADAQRLLMNFMGRVSASGAGCEVQRLSRCSIGARNPARILPIRSRPLTARLCSPISSVSEKPGRLDDYALARGWHSSCPTPRRTISFVGLRLRVRSISRGLAGAGGSIAERARVPTVHRRISGYWLICGRSSNRAGHALYPDYYLDDLLTESAEQERSYSLPIDSPRPAFEQHCFRPTSPISTSGWRTIIGIPGVSGVALRRVELPANSRGRLMTQASVLK